MALGIDLVVHGGPHEFLSVIDGLVERNARAIREGKVPMLSRVAPSRIAYHEAPVWRDAPSALAAHHASAGTLAAWAAAEQRLLGDATASVGMLGGVPVVISGFHNIVVGGAQPTARSRSSSMQTDPSDPSLVFGRPRHLVPGLVGAVANDRGRITERMELTIDDDIAQPVREIGDAIARHNARMIEQMGLPKLYDSKVRYQTEGPEKWWDAPEIIMQGHDDCEGLAAYRAGELRLDGHDARVWTRLIHKPSKVMGGSGKDGRLFHAITRVDFPNGTHAYDDPSTRVQTPMPRPKWYLQYAARQRAAGKEL
jgi:hypothetical protein